MITLIGRKLGMTQVFGEDGQVTGVTVLEFGPSTVVQKKSTDTDGYEAIQLGFEDIAERKVNKPLKGHFDKNKVALKKYLYENSFKTAEEANAYEVGQELKVGDFFKEGDFVDVQGKSRGKGFAGVVKKYNFRGGHATHAHEYFRHPGSIGQASYPGKVFKGKKMPGRMGDNWVTVQNLKVVEINPEKGIVVVKGAVPGCEGTLVFIKKAVKKTKIS